MNVVAYDRHEERRIARLLARAPLSAASSSAARSAQPGRQGVSPSDLRAQVHQVGPVTSLIRVGTSHYVATIGTRRYEGTLAEVHDQLKPIFARLSIA